MSVVGTRSALGELEAASARRRMMDLSPDVVGELAAVAAAGDPLVQLASAVLGPDGFRDRYAAAVALGEPGLS